MDLPPSPLFADPAFLEYGVALGVGGLIGLERERHLQESDVGQFGGIRSFILVALAGALCGSLAQATASALPIAVGIASVLGVLAVSYIVASREAGRALGMTTEFAGLVTFLLGAMAVVGSPQLTGMLGVLVSLVLAIKGTLHRFVGALSREDLLGALKLLVASVIVLPLLPDEAVDPWGVLNPWRLWLLAVFISGMGFVGYVAIRRLGAGRGLVVTGALGGVVSSTAATASIARLSREGLGGDASMLGLLLAWTVMVPRVALEVLVVRPSLLERLALPLAVFGLACLLAVGLFAYRVRVTPEATAELEVDNPFELWPAVQFAALFAAVLVLVEIVRQEFHSSWLYVVAGLSGLVDVDAITLSLAEQVGTGLAADVATGAILVAVLANTLVKVGIAVVMGSRALRVRALAVGAALSAVGIGVVIAGV